MPGPLSSLLNARRALPVALVLLTITALLPARNLAWAGWFGTLVQTLAAPISHPVSRFIRWVVPAAPLVADEDAGSRAWRLRAEEFETLYLRERSANDRLLEKIALLQSGLELNPGLGVRQLATPVIGASSDLSSGLMSVRAPRGSNITPGTSIAVVEGVQLLGRVDSVRAMIAQVRPITDRSASRVEGVVVLGDSREAPRLRCSLAPAGDGTLIGPVENPAGLPMGVALAVGHRVRLSDPTWPESAQELILGQVASIQPNPEQPLRQMLVVRPLVDLSRVSEVVLRIPVSREDAGAESARTPAPAPVPREGGAPP